MQLNSNRRIKGRHQRSGGAREVAGPNGEGACGKKTVVHTVPCCNQKATMQPPLEDTFCDARKVESPTSSCECKLKKQLHGDTDWKECFEFRAIFQGQRNRQCCTGRKFERRPGKLPTREREKSTTNIWG